MNDIKKRAAALKATLSDLLSKKQATARTVNGSYNYQAIDTLSIPYLSSALKSAEHGLISEQAKLFDWIEEHDSHVYSELNKRRLAVTGLEYHIVPHRDANQSEIDRTQELSDIMGQIDGIEDTLYHLTDAIGKGFVAFDMDWQSGTLWVPNKLEFVPQRYFAADIDTGDLTYLNAGVQEPLREGRWLIHRHYAKSGYMEQSALFRVIALLTAYKLFNNKDMMRFLELYGLPLRLGKYPAGMDDKATSALLKAVRNIGNDGAGIIANNMEIDFIEAKNGKVDEFLNATAYWEEKQSKAILGGSLDGKTTTEARIMMYEKARREILLHDVKQIEPSITNGLLKPICLVNNLLPANRMPCFKYITEEVADRKAIADMLDVVINKVRLDVDPKWAHELIQIPMAEAGKGIGSDKKNIPASLRASLSKAPLTQQPSLADAYSKQLSDLMIPFDSVYVEQIGALVNEAGSFEAALSSLTDLAAKPIDTNKIDELAKGLMASNLAGRASI